MAIKRQSSENSYYSHHNPDHILDRAAPTHHRHIKDRTHYTYQKILIGGVVVMTLIVFGMWVLNAKTMLYDVKHDPKTPEQELFANAKKDFSDIIAGINNESSKAHLLEQSDTTTDNETNSDETTALAEKLTQALTAMAATSSTASQAVTTTITNHDAVTTTSQQTTQTTTTTEQLSE